MDYRGIFYYLSPREAILSGEIREVSIHIYEEVSWE